MGDKLPNGKRQNGKPMYIVLLVLVVTGLCGFLFWRVLKSRNLDIWILPYLKQSISRRPSPKGKITKVYFCFVDHYEPYMLNTDDIIAEKRVKEWVEKYPLVAKQHRDSAGNIPKHTFFYPIEEYREDLLDKIADLCHRGYGDVEIHLHHDNDTKDGTSSKLLEFKQILFDRHELLRRDPETGEIIYAFIHGNWALDNSRPDGKWCGVDNELEVLEKTGCYMDMTMPSAPSDTQTRKINSIYWAKGCNGKRKSHDTGRDAVVGNWKQKGELLMVQGPLTLNWRQRKNYIMPKIESGEISYDAPPSDTRVRLWEKTGVCIRGAEQHIFIKVHTHGALEKNSRMLFDWGFDSLWSSLESQFRDQPGYELHYQTAWEMYQTIKEISGTAK